jgi:dihydrolipoamide dehydrogenase
MDHGKGVDDILKSFYPHPTTTTEGIEKCLRMLLNKSVDKPHGHPDHLKIHCWHLDLL